jgi:tRNA pseudouridine38-40 synthase
MLHRYKLLISYDGTHYAGWQNQPHDVTIQSLIENALSSILKEKIHIFGAGRTDSGVHALAQVAHFTLAQPLPLKEQRLFAALNGLLPHDIRILDVKEVSPLFHAQKSATRKIYHYHLWLQRPISPFYRLYRHYPYEKINLEILKQAAACFTGTKDFTTFANSSQEGSASKNAVRTIFRLDVVEQEGGVRLEFEGNGFLYKMVRNIVGTLLDVASGKRSLDEIERLFLAKDRRLASMAAPARGLFLVNVDYPENLLNSPYAKK